MNTRRHFLSTTAATVTLLPFAFGAAHADGHASGDAFDLPDGGQLRVTPVSHASFVMETDDLRIAVDPVGDADPYLDGGPLDLILVTHAHGDHFNLNTLIGLTDGSDTKLVVNAGLPGMLNDDLKARATALANGEDATLIGVGVEAIPAYNITEDRLNFHPKGRDNGYVVTLGGMRIYISGDTEDIPEMRALQNIDLAFVCMNLPFTMDAQAAASAVSEFAPTYVYPYHFRGRGNGTQDPAEFANLLTSETETKLGPWYS